MNRRIFSAGPKMLRNNSKKNKSPERAISFRHWTTLESTTNSDDYEDIDWKPISRHQRTRKPINLSGRVGNSSGDYTRKDKCLKSCLVLVI